jgi:hypothetical protein
MPLRTAHCGAGDAVSRTKEHIVTPTASLPSPFRYAPPKTKIVVFTVADAVLDTPPGGNQLHWFSIDGL